MWSSCLKEAIIHEFFARVAGERYNVGGVWGTAEVARWASEDADQRSRFHALVKRIDSTDQVEAASAALVVMEAAYEGKVIIVPGLIDGLLGLLEGDNPTVRMSAAWALGWLSQSSFLASRDVPPWVPTATDTDRVVGALTRESPEQVDTRRWLADVLSQTKDPKALDPLLQLVHDPNQEIRRTACVGLGNLGNVGAMQPLLGVLDDPDEDVKCSAIRALGQLHDRRAVDPLLARLDDGSSLARHNVIDSLAELGDERAVEPLIARLYDSDIIIRSSAVRALGQLGDRQAIEPLARLIDGEDPDVSVSAATALAQLDKARAVDKVMPLLASVSREKRLLAIGVLAIDLSKTDRALLSRDIDGRAPWLDPAEPISNDHVSNCSEISKSR